MSKTVPSEARLRADQVEWVVNDLAELGVKIGDQFFFLYKGTSLVYGALEPDPTKPPIHEEGGDPLVGYKAGDPMRWRHVRKREFGECAFPINYDDPTKIGTVSYDDGDDWSDLPAAGYGVDEDGREIMKLASAPSVEPDAGVVEQAAEAIYARLPYDGQGSKPAWVTGGNSLKQAEARIYARAAIAAMPGGGAVGGGEVGDDGLRARVELLDRLQAPRIIITSKDGQHGVACGGTFDGWKMWRHPDGKWVSAEKCEIDHNPFRSALQGDGHD